MRVHRPAALSRGRAAGRPDHLDLRGRPHQLPGPVQRVRLHGGCRGRRRDSGVRGDGDGISHPRHGSLERPGQGNGRQGHLDPARRRRAEGIRRPLRLSRHGRGLRAVRGHCHLPEPVLRGRQPARDPRPADQHRRGRSRRRRRLGAARRRGRRTRRPTSRSRGDLLRLLEQPGSHAVGVPQPLVPHGRLRSPPARRVFAFVDRKKDAVRRRGENVSSIELERAIAGPPGDRRGRHPRGRRPSSARTTSRRAWWQPREPPDLEELFSFFRDNLPYFAVPRYVEFVAALPKNAVGRVLKHQLRSDGVNENTIDLQARGFTVSVQDRRK